MFLQFAFISTRGVHPIRRVAQRWAAVGLAAAAGVAAAPRSAAAETPLAAAVVADASDVGGSDASLPSQAAASTPDVTTPPPPAAAASPFTAGWQDGFSVQSNNGDYRLTLGLVTQVDGRFAVGVAKPITNTFTIRRARPVLAGRVAKYFDYRFMPDFGNGASVLMDAYFDVRFSGRFRVRIGKDKTPIGYELLISDAGLFFPERSLASLLVPNRDVGIQAQGDLAGGRLYYAAGVFNGVPDGVSETTEVDTNNGKDLAGRLVIQPFRAAGGAAGRAASGLGFQVGGSTGQETGALPSFKTSIGQTFFSYSGANASGTHTRVTPAAFYYYERFGGFGEYVRSSQVITKGAATDTVTNDGWDVSGSFILAGGGTASDRPVRPRANFDPANRHWGAIQLVARYAELRVDNDAFTSGFASAGSNRTAQQYTAGVNWYPNPYIKYYLNFERTVFDGAPHGARPAEDAVLLRAQLAF